ncbi:hypothetical protein [Echinimonas agarilytica]|uniref:Uncharacterized protein n=1 Tax=Echinimonas agarilytica TaxID=1215918 RepID=A0AA41W7L6_9GAMM|nr:hypothetical protein [Echinimonas agarilytica]MCM2679863.1 hypothetical protein [Echinimonas agarilytica]
MSVIVPLWLLWLVLWFVFTYMIVRQSKKLIANIQAHDADYIFPGWKTFLLQMWQQKFDYDQESELYYLCVDYRKLLRVWVFMAILVAVVRFIILVMNV